MISTERASLAVATAGLAAGAAAYWPAQRASLAASVWAGTLLFTGLPLVWQTVRELRRRRFQADVVAALALVVAFAQQQYAAGLVVVMMLTTGQVLEAYSRRRAADALAALLERAPRVAHRRRVTADGSVDLADVQADDVRTGDVLIVRPGELIPVDGVVVEGETSVDESA